MDQTTMQAAVHQSYGTPDEVSIEQVPVPEPGPGEVLVRVEAAAVNHGDMFLLRGNACRLALGFWSPQAQAS